MGTDMAIDWSNLANTPDVNLNVSDFGVGDNHGFNLSDLRTIQPDDSATAGDSGAGIPANPQPPETEGPTIEAPTAEPFVEDPEPAEEPAPEQPAEEPAPEQPAEEPAPVQPQP